YVGAIIGAVVAFRQAKARREATPHLGPPASWPPLRLADAPVPAVGDLSASEPPVAAVGDLATEAPRPVRSSEPGAGDPVGQNGDHAWVAPVDGACPITHPIKANNNTGIYHLPGTRFYDRTQAERCYTDAASAEADGYRAAKTP
ncbi:MAG: hypothetical protein ABW122_02600, partial [Ilumatobacteraceae bacterium]